LLAGIIQLSNLNTYCPILRVPGNCRPLHALLIVLLYYYNEGAQRLGPQSGARLRRRTAVTLEQRRFSNKRDEDGAGEA
jgi:hypothetical protein